MSSLKLKTTSGGSLSIQAADGASDNTVTLPAVTGGNIVTTADSGTITQGMIGSGVAGSGPAFRAYIGGGTNQSISASTWTKVNLATELFDTDSCFDNVTNYRFTPNVAGYYHVNGQIMHNMTGTTTVVLTSVYKNGSSIFLAEWANWTFGSGNSVNCSDIVYMNGTTDYLELYGYSGSSSASFERNSGNTFLSATLVRAA